MILFLEIFASIYGSVILFWEIFASIFGNLRFCYWSLMPILHMYLEAVFHLATLAVFYSVVLLCHL